MLSRGKERSGSGRAAEDRDQRQEGGTGVKSRHCMRRGRVQMQLLAGAARMHDPTNELSYQKREENVVYNACTTCECGILCRV
eukprot:1650514-Prymnesium_polylepis.1